MIQVRKSGFCEISAIFIQCCFMSKTQVLMAVSVFSEFFSRNRFLEGGFTFNAGFGFQLEQASILSGGYLMGGISFDGGWG